jgi:hypothetical protein
MLFCLNIINLKTELERQRDDKHVFFNAYL